jgi:hypothetical protein
VAGSVATTTTRSPAHDPAAPCSATNTAPL